MKRSVSPEFYRRLSDLGFVIYPGKLTDTDSFRIGCIGNFGADGMRAAVAAVKTGVADDGHRIFGVRVKILRNSYSDPTPIPFEFLL